MEQSGVPIVTGIRIENPFEESWNDPTLTISISPSLGTLPEVRLERLRPGEIRYLDTVDLRLEPGRLRTVLEAERGRLEWVLRDGEVPLASGASPIEVLAFNEWPGSRGPLGLLAAFVIPNHSRVAELLRQVSERLHALTGSSALDGYQSESPERVLAMVRALYEVVQAQEIIYVGLPASFEALGQKVRLVDQLLDERMGNCLDLTLLFAACLEQMGLAPVLLFTTGHAFVGVWLEDDRFPDSVVRDAARVRTSLQLKKLLCLESTAATARAPLSFVEAVSVAHNRLTDDDQFQYALDVRVMRRERFRPLSLRNPGAMVASEPNDADADSVVATALTLGLSGERSRPGETPQSPIARTPLEIRFQRWREQLLDLSLRNRLLNFRIDGKSTLPMEVPDVANFEDMLAAEKVFTIHAKPPRDAADQRDEKLVKMRVDPETLRQQYCADLENSVVHCPYDQIRMISQATEIDREARGALEEGGANTLFVAIGLLRWFESEDSQVVRLAPLVLVPVTLDYSRTKREARLRRLAEDTLGNVTLVEKMKRDFAVDLSALVNLEPDDRGVDIPGTLRAVRAAIQRIPRWEVLDVAHLGLFSFAKFLLWSDLQQNAQALLANPLVRHIAEASGRRYVSGGPEVRPEQLDAAIAPSEVPVVMDADSTQMSAVVGALRGRTFVLQGPPGTGKSQTIANIIAAAVGAGKSVLFVSEKMAALDVVHRRLNQVGLGDFCLELHSNKANRKEAIESLGKSLNNRIQAPQASWQALSATLGDMRGQLNDYVQALHVPRPIGLSFFRASARLIALQTAPDIRISLPNMAALTAAEYAKLLEAAATLGISAGDVAPVNGSAWVGSSPQNWSSELDDRVRGFVEAALSAFRSIERVASALAQTLAVSAPTTLSAAEDLACLARAVGSGPVPAAAWNDVEWSLLRNRASSWLTRAETADAQRHDLATRWQASVYALELEEMTSKFGRWASAFVLLAWLMLWSARRRLRAVAVGALPTNQRIAHDFQSARALRAEDGKLDALRPGIEQDLCCAADRLTRTPLQAAVKRSDDLRVAVQRIRAVCSSPLDHVAFLSSPATPSDRRAQLAAASSQLTSTLSELRSILRNLAGSLALSDSIEGLSLLDLDVRLERWRREQRQFRPWCLYQRAHRDASQAGVGPIAEAVAAGSLSAKQSRTAAERGLLTTWLGAVRDRVPVLRDFDGPNHHRLAEKFREQDRQHIELARHEVVTAAIGRIPVTNDAVADSSEPGILRRETGKKRGHMAIRKLLTQIPNLLPRLKPCLLMSPLSVAQFLPAKGPRFDLVVFDEASQICTHDAIGALARGEQAIIVGDSRQLPPTNFFQRSADTSGDADDESADQESILDEAVAAGLEEQWLSWHYRSRHESLIDFSNQNYYEGRLHIFPAARGRVEELGVHWHPVPNGVYDCGGTRRNQGEAEAVVGHLVKALLRAVPGQRSFGVVTLNIQQQKLILDLLDDARAAHPEIEHHFAPGLNEPVFVKNLENVQGDERDEIYMTIGYAPDKRGVLIMSFGPLNRKGGERRLNVAITRARQTLRVFSTLTSDGIDLSRTKARGVAHLKKFLRYAATHGQDAMRGTATAAEFDSDFERDVFEALASNGHGVDSQVGCGGYRIDLAIQHPKKPGTYALGIECDGAAYHSAATARDRDRLRQSVLEALGWRLHRIWSTDWFLNRERELERLEKSIEGALAEPEGAHQSPTDSVFMPADAATLPEGAASPQARSGVIPAAQPVVAAVPLSEPLEPVIARTADAPLALRAAAARGRAPNAYVRAQLDRISTESETIHAPHHYPVVAACVAQVLEIEAPIHLDELARRVGEAFGARRVTDRLRTRVLEPLHELCGSYRVFNQFVWPAHIAPDSYRTVRAGNRNPELVPLEELAAACLEVLNHSFSIERGELLRETVRIFGVNRLGGKTETRMLEALKLLERWGHCGAEGERVVLKTAAP